MNDNIFFGQNKVGDVGGYGLLYNWWALAGLAPTDYKVHTNAEFNVLITALGGQSVAAGKMKEPGGEHWLTPNIIETPDSGFNAFGGGERTSAGAFENLKNFGLFWCSDQFDANSGLAYRLQSATAATGLLVPDKNYGQSARMLYTGAGTPTEVTDNDGNPIPVALMPDGNYWTTENWKCTTLDNGDPIPEVTDNAAWAALGTLGRCFFNNDPKNE